ncbi:hypothetical protein [Bradyrhizobium sp. BWA-3-5]|uniref:hypothetical protein n=1 Tax=Bradyrhizobium sp. BWA-3-5 TaxID=3080013 RepID=UPI00293F7216|nr:hypothetical protein [Bradyrhizobium sp. BWA-3-5]WOH68096.1 hypothetical protein RX331_10435 [Bradyrhizobium sp. BWA-3-5]
MASPISVDGEAHDRLWQRKDRRADIIGMQTFVTVTGEVVIIARGGFSRHRRWRLPRRLAEVKSPGYSVEARWKVGWQLVSGDIRSYRHASSVPLLPRKCGIVVGRLSLFDFIDKADLDVVVREIDEK